MIDRNIRFFRNGLADDRNHFTRERLFSYEEKPIKEIPLGSKVLDVGCGGGRVANLIARRGYSVVGLDIVPEMCREAGKEGVAQYIVGRAEFLPFKDSTFDYVICLGSSINTFNSSDRIKVALREMSRVLKIGGGVLISGINLISPKALISSILSFPITRSFGTAFHRTPHNGFEYLGIAHHTTKKKLLEYISEAGFKCEVVDREKETMIIVGKKV